MNTTTEIAAPKPVYLVPHRSHMRVRYEVVKSLHAALCEASQILNERAGGAPAVLDEAITRYRVRLGIHALRELLEKFPMRVQP